MPRPKRKTEITTLKMTPEIRSLWEQCAERERRTLTNMFEVMVWAYAKQIGLPGATAPANQASNASELP